MERRFDMTNFEQSLKDQADQFDMIPSRRVWHGIYNDLHPGSKWPSIAMTLVFLFTLLGIGHLNNSSRQYLGIITPSENNEPSINTEHSAQAVVTSIVKNHKSESHQNGIASINLVDGGYPSSTSEDLAADGVQKSQFTVPLTTGAKVIPLFPNGINANQNSFGDKVPAVDKKLPATDLSGLAAGDNVSANLQERILTGTDSKEQQGNAENNGKNNIGEIKTQNADKDITDVENNSYPGLLMNNEITDDYTYLVPSANVNLNSAAVDLTSASEVKGKQQNIALENKTNAAGNKMTAKIRKKRNEKIRWLYFVTPTITTANFTGKGFLPRIDPNASQIILQNSQPANGMKYHARLGYEVGTQMSYTFMKNLQFLTGLHLSYSGFNVISNQVHPTFATLLLKDESSGLPYAKNFITHYGNGEGQNQISLANYSLQLSIPVGLQYALFDNHKIQIQLASTIEPSFVMKSNSFIISSDQRYYVNDPGILRKVNFNGNIGSYVTFVSNKVHWQVGPNVRYQLLSTYQNIYPVNEHLVDYGIRIGISR